jgi:hypothetical protein
MSPRIGPIVIALASMAMRLAGDRETADFVALTAISALTLVLQRTSDLQAAATAVRYRTASAVTGTHASRAV